MRAFAIPLILLLVTPGVPADPAWWGTRGVTNQNPAANLAPATIGQAKHMAAMALAELENKLPTHQALVTDLGQIVNLSLPEPLPADFHEQQRAILLTGQLKAMAKPFYDHLRAHDAAWLDNAMNAVQIVVMEPGTATRSPYPWSESTTDDANRAPATLGQLKAVFSLPLETLTTTPPQLVDTDGDGMLDAWEIQFGLNPNDPSDAALDSDGDGLSNLEEFQLGTNPQSSDSDGDGISDWDEINLYGTDPTVSDSDGDGITDGGEIDGGTDPNDPAETPAAEWVKLTGDLEVDQRKQETRTITIPKGQTRLVLVVLHSEEYPYYTESGSEFNDLLDWRIESTGSNPITGQVDVNARHVDWMAAEYEMTEIEGYYPAHMEQTQTLSAPPDQDLTVEIELGATNIGDGALPSTVMVGLLPVEVAIRKKGDVVPPNGVLALSGDLMEFALAPSFFDAEDNFENQITWQFRQRKADGTFEGWGEVAIIGQQLTGSKFECAFVLPGIYQVKAVIANAGEYEYKRKKDEKIGNSEYGPGKKGQPDCIGICSGQIQLNICREAQNFYGSEQYAASNILAAQYGFPEYPASGNSIIRCNIFVAHRATAAGAVVPKINGFFNEYPPLANEWAGIEDTSIWPGDPTYIANWPFLPPGTHPQPGCIIAHPQPGDAGHCAITDYDGEGIGAGVSGTVNKNYDEFWDGTSRLRKYQP